MGVGVRRAGLLGFAVGSIPVGLIVAGAARGIDIRRYGTGNIGASNVFHNVGLRAAAVVGVASFAQGYLPARVVRLGGGGPPAAAAAAVGSVCGYAWSPLLRLRGGSAVGTATGALAALDSRALLPLLVCYAVGGAARRPARGVLAGFVAQCAWSCSRRAPRAHTVASVLITSVVVVKRFDGVRDDLRRAPAPQVLLARLLDDRRLGRPLRGRAAQASGHQRVTTTFFRV